MQAISDRQDDEIKVDSGITANIFNEAYRQTPFFRCDSHNNNLWQLYGSSYFDIRLL